MIKIKKHIPFSDTETNMFRGPTPFGPAASQIPLNSHNAANGKCYSGRPFTLRLSECTSHAHPSGKTLSRFRSFLSDGGCGGYSFRFCAFDIKKQFKALRP
jgi:hypothetical protein